MIFCCNLLGGKQMSLRIRRAGGPGAAPEGQEPGNAILVGAPRAADGDGDGWAARLAKLIPAEALGLYGVASSQVPAAGTEFDAQARAVTLWIVVLICLGFSAVIRLRATADGGGPQWAAVAISVVSFLVWLVALGPPGSPVQLPAGFTFAGPLAAIIWATLVSYFYRGDAA